MSERTILIVDDDAFIRRPLEFVLRAEGYRPITAVDGEDGLEKARSERPDLIFLDVMMPGLDGYSVCRRLREDAALAATPVILLTAKGQERDRMMAFESGATEFMSKPYSPSELVRRVRELLQGGAP